MIVGTTWRLLLTFRERVFAAELPQVLQLFDSLKLSFSNPQTSFNISLFSIKPTDITTIAMEILESILRPILLPITTNLPKPIASFLLSLLGPQCYTSLVLNFTLGNNNECIRLAISKALGIGIVGLSSIVKIPQLLKLLNSRSASGVSFLSYALETIAFVITLAYNARSGFPFSTYGESALIAVQNVAIALAVLHFSGKDAMAGVFVAGLAGLIYALFSADIIGQNMLNYAQAGAGFLGVASKIPQILEVRKQKGTGQLSAFAVFNYLFGSLARVFTTLQEVDDKLILGGFLAGFVLNAVLAAQMVYYWNSPASKRSESVKLTEKGKDTVKHAVASGVQQAKSPSTRRRA